MSHLSSFPLICPLWAGAAVELGRDSKLPVICNINHVLYRPPCLHHLPPIPPGLTQRGPGLSWAFSMSLDLCLPSFFFFLNQYSSLATARIQYYHGAGILAGAPGGDSSSTGQSLWAVLDLTIEHLASSPCGGSGFWAPTVLLLLSFSSSHLCGRGVFKTNLVSKNVYICGEGGGFYLRERDSMCVCVFVSISVWIFLSFFKNAVLFVSVCPGSVAVSDFFQLYLSI